MNLVEIPEKDIRIDVPEHWDEMNQNQLRYCLRQAVFASLGIITPEEARIRALYYLLGIERDWKTLRWEKTVSKEVLNEKNSKIILLCEQLCYFLFKEVGEDKLEVNYDTVINHFPVLRSGRTLLYGPASLMSDLTYGEFRAAVEEMTEFFDTKSEIHLSRMIACVYRPERDDWQTYRKSDDFDGRQRQPFNRARIDENVRYTEKIGKVERRAFLLWFTYTLAYIQNRDIVISGREVNFSILFPKSKQTIVDSEKRDTRGSGWTGILYSVAEQHVFGNIEATDRSGLFDILIYLYDKALENQKMKAKHKRK